MESWRYSAEILASARLRPNATVIVDTIRSVAGIAALRADYDRLSRVASNTLPFAFTGICIALSPSTT